MFGPYRSGNDSDEPYDNPDNWDLNETWETFVVDGETLADAREAANKQREILSTQGVTFGEERVFEDKKPVAISGNGATVEDAFISAQNQLPKAVMILEKVIVRDPEIYTFDLSAFDEDSARRAAMGRSGVVKNIRLLAKGSQGILGIGKKPNRYEIEFLANAWVRIIYKSKARIEIDIKKS